MKIWKTYSIEQLIADAPPLFADTKTAPVSYAIDPGVLRFIDSNAKPDWTTCETGAGATTVALAIKNCRHTAIMPDLQVKTLVENLLDIKQIDRSRLEIVLEKSQWYLPSLALGRMETLDLAVIDGDHSLPLPFLDYYYFAHMLKIGGYLVVDNIELCAPELLMKFLRFERFWRSDIYQSGTCIIFRKVVPFIDAGWSEQPWALVNGRHFPEWGWENISTLFARAREDSK